jgi:hypothetical protein
VRLNVQICPDLLWDPRSPFPIIIDSAADQSACLEEQESTATVLVIFHQFAQHTSSRQHFGNGVIIKMLIAKIVAKIKDYE